ncbi:MAG: hypothetical protein ACKOSS_03685 [Planctomycetia bacterium]
MSTPRPPRDPHEQALDDALALWADDARAHAARRDPARLARTVAARIAADPEGVHELGRRAPFGYAAAAAALLAVGVAGSLLVAPPAAAQAALAPQRLAPELEDSSLAVVRRVHLEQFPRFTQPVEGR